MRRYMKNRSSGHTLQNKGVSQSDMFKRLPKNMIYKDIYLFRLVDNDIAKAFDLPRSQIALRANEPLCKYGR